MLLHVTELKDFQVVSQVIKPSFPLQRVFKAINRVNKNMFLVTLPD